MRFQRKCAVAAAAVAVLWCCASAHGQQKPPFTITISGPQTISAGDDLTIRIVTTNVSDPKVAFCKAPNPDGTVDVERYYKVTVYDESGKEPPITDFGRQAKRNDPTVGSRTLCGVDPNETLVYSMDISKQYDLSKPGKYVLQVSRGVSDLAPSSAVVKSNEITVTVVPKQPSARGQQKPPIAIVISGPQTIVAGDNLTVQILETHVTDQVPNLCGPVAQGTIIEAYFKVAIHDENGRVPPITDFGQKVKTHAFDVVQESAEICYLAPKGTLAYSLDISKQYDLSKPGRYTVQVTRSVSDKPPSNDVVKSNELTVTVVPKQPSAMTPPAQ